MEPDWSDQQQRWVCSSRNPAGWGDGQRRKAVSLSVIAEDQRMTWSPSRGLPGAVTPITSRGGQPGPQTHTGTVPGRQAEGFVLFPFFSVSLGAGTHVYSVPIPWLHSGSTRSDSTGSQLEKHSPQGASDLEFHV